MDKKMLWLFAGIVLSIFGIFFTPEKMTFDVFLFVMIIITMSAVLSAKGVHDFFEKLDDKILEIEPTEQTKEKILEFLALICAIIGIVNSNILIELVACVSVYAIILSVVTREIKHKEEK